MTAVAIAPYRDIAIEGDTFTLRAWRLSDVDAAFDIWGRDEVARWLLMDTVPDKDAQAAKLVELLERYEVLGRGFGNFALVPKGVDRPVGGILLKPLDGTEMVEVGWHLNPDYQNRGYATAGAIRLVRYGFEDLGLDKIHAVVLPSNGPSNAVAQKVGLVDTGRPYVHEGLTLRLYQAARTEWSPPAT